MQTLFYSNLFRPMDDCFVFFLYYMQTKMATVDGIKMEEVFTMKKSRFAAMILGTIRGTLFALGRCMALIPMGRVCAGHCAGLRRPAACAGDPIYLEKARTQAARASP